MASDDKKTKADPAPKAEPAPKNDAGTKEKSTAADGAAKAESGATAGGAPANYSRGEGQKPVTAAYKENWNAIFAKKSAGKTKKNAKKKKR
jgi:hypothetical protein